MGSLDFLNLQEKKQSIALVMELDCICNAFVIPNFTALVCILSSFILVCMPWFIGCWLISNDTFLISVLPTARWFFFTKPASDSYPWWCHILTWIFLYLKSTQTIRGWPGSCYLFNFIGGWIEIKSYLIIKLVWNPSIWLIFSSSVTCKVIKGLVMWKGK